MVDPDTRPPIVVEEGWVELTQDNGKFQGWEYAGRMWHISQSTIDVTR
jgi:hypothetical protein